MIKIILNFIEYNFDIYLETMVFELYKLVDVVNFNVVEPYISFYVKEMKSIHEVHFPNSPMCFRINDFRFAEQILFEVKKFNLFAKFILIMNLFFVKMFFFKITNVTFWLIPNLFILLFAIVLLFFSKPNGINIHIWKLSIKAIFIIFIFQLLLLYIFITFYNAGIILKVGLSGAFNLPFNLSLAKLISFLIILFCILITLFIYLDFYAKNLLMIKIELCSILFFLGFGCGMVFLQNDLFSLFLYFEIISFCIYGLLFLQKWTNSQLHSLIRYVLFSLWISTCYIVGIAFYISAFNSSTNLFEFKNFDAFSFENNLYYNNDMIFLITQDFEIILALTFLLIYFFFKLGVGPFYTWTIEVYNSCTTGTLLAVSLIPKLIYLPILFFILFFNFIEYYHYWTNVLFIFGFLTVFIGSFGILITDKLKEIYGWSSLVHTGNLLLILSCLSHLTLSFLMFYLISYFIISLGFILLILSMWNTYTGWFIKTIFEFNAINHLNSNFYLISLILLSSASGFTPFLSFFMKFSLLNLMAEYHGIILTILIGLLNIIGSIAYLWILWNIIGFNAEKFDHWSKDLTFLNVNVILTYWINLLLNFICFFIIFSFIFYKDFLEYFNYFSTPFVISETNYQIIPQVF